MSWSYFQDWGGGFSFCQTTAHLIVCKLAGPGLTYPKVLPTAGYCLFVERKGWRKTRGSSRPHTGVTTPQTGDSRMSLTTSHLVMSWHITASGTHRVNWKFRMSWRANPFLEHPFELVQLQALWRLLSILGICPRGPSCLLLGSRRG